MKRYSFLLLFIITAFGYHEKIFGQEEFHDKQNGLSLSFMQGFNTKSNAAGLSFYSKKGIIVGMGLERVNHTVFPTFSLLLYPSWIVDSSNFKLCLGPTYANLPDQHIVGLFIGLIRCFYTKSAFPFSLSVSFLPQLLFSRYPDDYYLSGKYQKTFTPVIGFGYHQAFFKNNKVYPVIGLSYAKAFESDERLFSAVAGFNVKL